MAFCSNFGVVRLRCERPGTNKKLSGSRRFNRPNFERPDRMAESGPHARHGPMPRHPTRPSLRIALESHSVSFKSNDQRDYVGGMRLLYRLDRSTRMGANTKRVEMNVRFFAVDGGGWIGGGIYQCVVYPVHRRLRLRLEPARIMKVLVLRRSFLDFLTKIPVLIQSRSLPLWLRNGHRS
ncbi:hypothetical protein B0H12DRAFT_1114425 [Mycena haematopus]|nr:hypothetical protein B0H12DRAFT_1114425 [Mycena haematopus]